MKKLNSAEMATFVARGFLRLDAVVPEAINDAFLNELTAVAGESATPRMQRLMQDGVVPQVAPGTALPDAYPEGSALANMLAVPEVAGAVESLVGSNCVVDHHFLHTTTPGGTAQHTHQDSTIDPRTAFDVQLFYFPHNVDASMGGTRFVPGTHLRIVSEMGIARYQNLRGQQRIVCPAGTVVFFHHGLWHGAGANRSDATRYVCKIRLCPSEAQRRRWDTSDLPDAGALQAPVFWCDPEAPQQPVERILTTPEPWFEQDTGRLEFMNRIRLWRYLTGDEQYDIGYWMTRVENEHASIG